MQQEKTREAEQMLALGNSALENGDPQQARRAFQSAYGLSRNDAAFNAGLTTAQIDWVAVTGARTITWAFNEWASPEGPVAV